MNTYSLIIPSSIGVDKPIEFIENKLWVIPLCDESKPIESDFTSKNIKFIFNEINNYHEIENLIKEWFTFFGFLLPIPSNFSYLALNKHIYKTCFENPSKLKIENYLENVRLPEKSEFHFYNIVNNKLLVPYNRYINENELNVVELYQNYQNLKPNNILRNNIELLSISKNLMVHASYFYDNIYYNTAHYYFLFESIINSQVPSNTKVTRKCNNCDSEIQLNLNFLDKVKIFFSEKGYNEENIEFIIKLIKSYSNDRSKIVHWGKKQTLSNAFENFCSKIDVNQVITLNDEIKHQGVSISSDIYFSELCQYILIEQLNLSSITKSK